MQFAPRRAWLSLALSGVFFAAGIAGVGAQESDGAMPGHGPMSDPMAAPEEMAAMVMPGMLGPYTMSREASGTSWQPDSTPVAGREHMGNPWTTMWDGFANLIDDHQGGPRGHAKSFSTSMLMFMGRRELDPGALGLRIMHGVGRSAHGSQRISGTVPDG